MYYREPSTGEILQNQKKGKFSQGSFKGRRKKLDEQMRNSPNKETPIISNNWNGWIQSHSHSITLRKFQVPNDAAQMQTMKIWLDWQLKVGRDHRKLGRVGSWGGVKRRQSIELLLGRSKKASCAVPQYPTVGRHGFFLILRIEPRASHMRGKCGRPQSWVFILIAA